MSGSGDDGIVASSDGDGVVPDGVGEPPAPRRKRPRASHACVEGVCVAVCGVASNGIGADASRETQALLREAAFGGADAQRFRECLESCIIFGTLQLRWQVAPPSSDEEPSRSMQDIACRLQRRRFPHYVEYAVKECVVLSGPVVLTRARLGRMCCGRCEAPEQRAPRLQQRLLLWRGNRWPSQ